MEEKALSRHKSAPQVIYTFEKGNRHGIKGLYSSNANAITVWLDEIQTPSDFYDTIEHEGIHAGLDNQDFIEDDEHDMIYDVMMTADDMY